MTFGGIPTPGPNFGGNHGGNGKQLHFSSFVILAASVGVGLAFDVMALTWGIAVIACIVNEARFPKESSTEDKKTEDKETIPEDGNHRDLLKSVPLTGRSP